MIIEKLANATPTKLKSSKTYTRASFSLSLNEAGKVNIYFRAGVATLCGAGACS